MKKLFLIICAVLGLTTAAYAQRPQFQLGYGGYTQMDGSDMHEGGSVDNAWGAITAGVNFPVARNFSLGATYTFSSTSYKHHSDDHVYYHVLMLNGKYDYYRSGDCRLYGHVGMGVDISHMAWDDDSKDHAYFAFQISPLGAEYTLSNVTNIFAEVGYGAQGVLQVGFRFNLR